MGSFPRFLDHTRLTTLRWTSDQLLVETSI